MYLPLHENNYNMAKGSGGTRLIGPPQSKSYQFYLKERERVGSMDNGIDYYNRKSGGFVIWQEGHKHPNEGRMNDEFKFAKELARAGYGVYLLPESKESGGVSFRLSRKGAETFPDAKTGSYYYEQTTKTSDSSKYGALSAFEHASDKGIGLVAIYDKHGALTHESIQKGIDWYEHNRNIGKGSFIKLHGAIVVNNKHEIYWHDMQPSETKWWEK